MLIAGVEGVAVALFLDAQDVGGAAMGGQQVGAGVGFDEGAHGGGAAQQAVQVVIGGGAEHGGDDVVAGALGAELDAEAVGEEVETGPLILHPQLCHGLGSA